MKILPGSSSLELGENISHKLNLPILGLKHKIFTDGESYLLIQGEVQDEEIIIVQNTFPDQEKNLIEIMLLASTLKEYKASKVYLLAPYLCYARADRRRIEKEVISHKIALELLYNSGVDSLITFNVHNRDAFSSFATDLEKYDLSVLPLINQYLKENSIADSVIIGPDKGIIGELQYLSHELDLEFYSLEKYRDPETHIISMKSENLDIENKHVILFDDVITSGGTAIDACKLILENNPATLTFIVIHALAKQEVFEKLHEIGVTKVLSSNTIARTDLEQLDITSIVSSFIEDKFL